MSPNIEKLIHNKSVMFLQGPMGGFFNQVAQWLQTKNIKTYKVNFNGGDHIFTQRDAYTLCVDYKGTLQGFSDWIETQIKEFGIESVVCFGDCRKYHQVAKNICMRLNIEFYVFEEGYVRPDYITFECGGVNANSPFQIDFETEDELITEEECKPVNNHYWLMVFSAIIYYSLKVFLHHRYPHYQHHRNLSTQKELVSWLKSGFRRRKNALIEPIRFKKFLEDYSAQYFVFPLQVHNDSQILVHTDLKDMEQYIALVIKDFSLNAQKHHQLVLKHHPMDRGYRHYARLIQRLTRQYHCEERVHYFCDIHLPSLLKNSLGVVTVNSTTGLQALYRDVPVKVLGRAIYNVNGLTYQESLSSFWLNAHSIDAKYYHKFRKKLIHSTQLNGAFYGKNFWKV